MQADEIGLLLKQEQGQFLAFLSAFEYRRGAGLTIDRRRSATLAYALTWRPRSGVAKAPGKIIHSLGEDDPGRQIHGNSKPLAVKACLTGGDVRNAISALAASTCLLFELMPDTYTE